MIIKRQKLYTGFGINGASLENIRKGATKRTKALIGHKPPTAEAAKSINPRPSGKPMNKFAGELRVAKKATPKNTLQKRGDDRWVTSSTWQN